MAVLLSGGVDSAACVAFYLKQRFSVSALFIDYGQIAARRERPAAAKIAKHFQIPLKLVRYSGLKQKQDGLIEGRNAFLAFTALMEMDRTELLLALGIHAGTKYYDCGLDFVRGLQSMMDGYTGGRVRLCAPFLHWNKNEIWEFCRESDVPLHLTYSCERGLSQPCGKCLSCRDMEALNACS